MPTPVLSDGVQGRASTKRRAIHEGILAGQRYSYTGVHWMRCARSRALGIGGRQGSGILLAHTMRKGRGVTRQVNDELTELRHLCHPSTHTHTLLLVPHVTFD